MRARRSAASVLTILGLSAAFLSSVAVAPRLARAEGESAAAVTSRDWSRFPAIVAVEPAGDILAVGDVHGDDERLRDLLVGSGVLSREGHWAAGKSVLVFTGDLIDKYPHGLDVIRRVRALESEARAAGGRVVPLAGNHELELLGHPDASKTGEMRRELEAAGIPLADVVSGKNELGGWLRERPFGARVGDWFFSHAGKTDLRTIPELERAIRTAIDGEGFGARELERADSLVNARLKPRPWWEVAGEDPLTVLDHALAKLGVRHLAFGHQPGAVHFADGTKRPKGEMFAFGSGRVFLIDTGMSRGVGDSTGALLRVRRRQGTTEAVAVGPDGSERVLWRETRR